MPHNIKQPLRITSGYRTPQTNAGIEGAARHSMHLKGQAADISMAGVPADYLAKLAKFFRAGGVGVYPDRGFVKPAQGAGQDDSSTVILLPDTHVPPPAPVMPPEATASRYAHPAPIRWLLAKGAVLVEEYPAVGGLRAFLMRSRQGRQETFYVTPDGSHMILGTLYTKEG